MILFLELVLAASILGLFYTYFGYPALLYALSRGGAQTPRSAIADADLPSVTVITAAFNEAAVIAETIENKLAADYPAAKLNMIVVSDESTDGTDDIVTGLIETHPGRLELIRQDPRQGKTAGLNLAVARATGDILVFSDANSIYEPQAIRQLVASFADPTVGYVTGKMIYTNADGSLTGDGCTTYMRFENALRSWETVFGSVIGVDGGIDAARRELYRPMNADQLPDFVLPLRIVEQGYRVAYQDSAVLRESALTDAGREYRMRVRVTLRALWALYDLRVLFNPLRDAGFSWQLFSHKFLRYTAFVPQFLAFVSNALLLGEGMLFGGLFLGQLFFYSLALVGYAASRSNISVPLVGAFYYISLLNLACAHASTRFLKGEKQVLWQPRSG